MKDSRPVLGIVGAGRVGQTLGRAWRSAGWPVAVAVCRSREHAETAAAFIGAETATTDGVAAAGVARVLLISTPDAQVSSTVEAMAAAGALTPEHVVLHSSGALGMAALASASAAGAAVGCIHPIHSFAAPVADGSRLAGVVWGVTAEPGARPVALALVADAGGEAVEVDEADRVIYHAAAAIASNATVGVLGFAVALLRRCGFADETAQRALVGLADGTLANVKELGVVDALTGPIVRGDVDTVARHLAAMASANDRWAEDYRVLSRLVLEVARRRGALGDAEDAALARLLDAKRVAPDEPAEHEAGGVGSGEA